MEVRPGYKQTEVGVIPEDWEVRLLSEGVKLLSGHHVLAKHCNTDGDGIPYITGPADFPNGVIQHTKYTTSPTTICRANDILVTVKGSGAGTLVLSDAEYCISRQLMAIRVDNWSTGYIYFSLLQNASLFGVAATGLIPGLSRSDILNKALPLPPTLAEQRAIAAALSDVDGLIAKKRAIKQGAMQQFLTGKTRLPGFSGPWEVRRLGEISEIKTGDKNNQDKVENGAYPFFVRSQTVERINTYSFDGEAILVPGEGGIGSIFHYINDKFDYHQRVYKISDFADDTCGKFIYFCMSQSFGKQATRHSVKATVDSLRLPTFEGFEFLAPSLEEQHAIAAALSDMDAEITALEARREKTRALKQGMMQELLTGRIRLTSVTP